MRRVRDNRWTSLNARHRDRPTCTVWATILATIFLVLMLGAQAPADTPPSQVYERDCRSPHDAIARALKFLTARDVDSVCFVFDMITFNPPPGDNEFRREYRYRADMELWADAIHRHAKPDCPRLFVSVTTVANVCEVTAGSRPAEWLTGTLTDDVWKSGSSSRFSSAATWMGGLATVLSGKRIGVVLICGLLAPENIAPAAQRDPWRSLLMKRGSYWDEEVVARTVRNQEWQFVVIAPEARFGDSVAATEIPQLPFVARPSVVSLRWDGDEKLSDIDWKEFRKNMVDLGVASADMAAVEERARASLLELRRSGCSRFRAYTPRFLPAVQGVRAFNTACPSGYGYWPLARSASAANGIYIFYPRRGPSWLDACPRDESLISRLAPDVESRIAWIGRCTDDPIVELMARVGGRLARLPLWETGSGSPPELAGFLAFEFQERIAFNRRFLERALPYDALELQLSSLRDVELSIRRANECIEAYETAIEQIARARTRFEGDPRVTQGHARSMANLRLFEFWLEMSAFHLEALRLFCDDLQLLSSRKFSDPVRVVYCPAIRLSDCLEAYDGRKVSAIDDAMLTTRTTVPPQCPEGSQSNFLEIRTNDERYRARRDLALVLRNLRPELLGRARRMIAAAERVMNDYARSGWGWIVYYSEASTFIVAPSVNSESKVAPVGKLADAVGDPTPSSTGDGPSTGK